MAQSGMEIMFRSMGLGQVLDMAKSLADKGVADKLVKFADDLDDMKSKVDEIHKELCRRNNIEQKFLELTGNERSNIIPGPGSNSGKIASGID